MTVMAIYLRMIMITVEVYRSSSGGDLFILFNSLPLVCEDFIYFISFIFKLSIKNYLQIQTTQD